MARLALNKSTLTAKTAQLGTFRQFLPSLDLKRRQLMAERTAGQAVLRDLTARLDEVTARVPERLPMLADTGVDLTDLVRVTDVRITVENVVGTRLPVLEHLRVERRDYALLGKPHWVDTVAVVLAEVAELRLRRRVAERRLQLLQAAVRVVTQRVNLFEKVLIPRTREEIRRIRLHLSDAERAAVVRAKIAKKKKRQVSS